MTCRNYPPIPDPGTPLLRLILIICWGALCFGAGTLYAPERKFAACTEIKPMPEPKPISQKQKLKIVMWMNRDKGYIK